MSENLYTQEDRYRLGMNAGFVFVEKANELFKEFAKDYENSDPNFTDEDFKDGFWKAFIDDVGFDVDG